MPSVSQNSRRYSLLDNICMELDQALRALTGNAKNGLRPYPAESLQENSLDLKQRQHAAALMRVNHAGEVCAQALYQAQGFVSKNITLKNKMRESAVEEADHLSWCTRRVVELGSHISYLTPLWFGGSFVIGLAAGTLGDHWNLGFLAETETQVIKHLDAQIALLPLEDLKSHAILKQMRMDETAHRDQAIGEGGVELPNFIKKAMGLIARVMVKTAYYV